MSLHRSSSLHTCTDTQEQINTAWESLRSFHGVNINKGFLTTIYWHVLWPDTYLHLIFSFPIKYNPHEPLRSLVCFSGCSLHYIRSLQASITLSTNHTLLLNTACRELTPSCAITAWRKQNSLHASLPRSKMLKAEELINVQKHMLESIAQLTVWWQITSTFHFFIILLKAELLFTLNCSNSSGVFKDTETRSEILKSYLMIIKCKLCDTVFYAPSSYAQSFG